MARYVYVVQWDEGRPGQWERLCSFFPTPADAHEFIFWFGYLGEFSHPNAQWRVLRTIAFR